MICFVMVGEFDDAWWGFVVVLVVVVFQCFFSFRVVGHGWVEKLLGSPLWRTFYVVVVGQILGQLVIAGGRGRLGY